jgi:hypothetical protein
MGGGLRKRVLPGGCSRTHADSWWVNEPPPALTHPPPTHFTHGFPMFRTQIESLVPHAAAEKLRAVGALTRWGSE